MAQNTGYMKMGADKAPREELSLGEMKVGAVAKEPEVKTPEVKVEEKTPVEKPKRVKKVK